MRLSRAKRQYRGEWLAFRIRREIGGDPEGEVVVHARSRNRLHLALRKRQEPDLYLTFSGPPVKPGYVVV